MNSYRAHPTKSKSTCFHSCKHSLFLKSVKKVFVKFETLVYTIGDIIKFKYST